MRVISAVAFLVVAFLVAGGCGSSSNPNHDTKVGEGSKFAARFDAARAMMIITDRDAALSKVAADAAQAGDVEVVQNCLAEIRVSFARDEAAYKAALSLAKAGKVNAGTEVAKSIMMVNRRDDALGKLAKGEFDK
jgi:hypothetical protein